MTQVVTLLLARHARVAVDGVCYGQCDVPTHMDDEEAAQMLLTQLEALAASPVRVWSSPWRRTRGPAERVAKSLGVPLTVDARLSELAFGAWEGRPYATLEKEPVFQTWMANWQSAAPPGGERLAELLARVAAWHAEAIASGDRALVLTHAGVIRALRAEARRIPYSDVVTEPVEPLRLERAE